MCINKSISKVVGEVNQVTELLTEGKKNSLCSKYNSLQGNLGAKKQLKKYLPSHDIARQMALSGFKGLI